MKRLSSSFNENYSIFEQNNAFCQNQTAFSRPEDNNYKSYRQVAGTHNVPSVKTGYRPRSQHSNSKCITLPGFSTNSNHSSECSSFSQQSSNSNNQAQIDNLCNSFSIQNFGFSPPVTQNSE